MNDPAAAAAAQLARADALLTELRGRPDAATRAEARQLLKPLRGQRAWGPLQALAEALGRSDPDDHVTRRLYAQALIEQGLVLPALSLMQAAAAALPQRHPEWAEAWGLVGRCHKQVFIEAMQGQGAGARVPAHARAALMLAIDAYARPYTLKPAVHHWHGVNLLALAARAGREGWTLPERRHEPAALAAELLERLQRQRKRDDKLWLRASLAEAALGNAVLNGRLEGVEAHLADYLFAPGINAFEVASTLRQFTEVWDLDTLSRRSRGSALRSEAQLAWALRLLDLMRLRLLQLPGGALGLSPAQLQGVARRAEAPPAALPAAARPLASATRAPKRRAGGARAPLPPPPPAAPAPGGQLEALLGQTRAKPMSWWRGALDASRAVALIARRMGPRLGSGFLVRAAEFGTEARPGELLLLTNFHVVNAQGVAPGVRPEMAEIRFEAAGDGASHAVEALLWESPVDEHDAALLRLKTQPPGVEPLPLSRALPPPPAEGTPEEDHPRVYVIGHPGGRELSISMADNALIDHEAPPGGKPARPGVWRVHYRAPTEGGSSGSPVFDDEAWSVLALHHKGGRFGMPRLNGREGTYAANEGLAIGALLDAARAALAPPPAPPSTASPPAARSRPPRKTRT